MSVEAWGENWASAWYCLASWGWIETLRFPSLGIYFHLHTTPGCQVLTPAISPKDQLLHPIDQAAAAGQGAVKVPEGGRGRQPGQSDSGSQEGSDASHTTAKPQNTSVQFHDTVLPLRSPSNYRPEIFSCKCNFSVTEAGNKGCYNN